MDALFGIQGHVTLAQECARAVVVFAYGLLALRLSGRRTFARWSALAAVTLLLLLHMVFSFAVARSDWLSDIVEGKVIALGRNGSVDDEMRRRHFVSAEDLEEALRQNRVERVDQTKAIHLEANGKISVIKKDD